MKYFGFPEETKYSSVCYSNAAYFYQVIVIKKTVFNLFYFIIY